jgi:hypothetical protein
MPLYDSWSDVQELLPKEVYSSIQKYWSAISSLQKLLTDTQKLFASTQTIWPDQCDWIIYASPSKHVIQYLNRIVRIATREIEKFAPFSEIHLCRIISTFTIKNPGYLNVADNPVA